MADYLCEGIIINILHRLPVKTLLRCTSVCKSWYSLITAPEFISSHLKFAAASPFLLLRRCIRNSEGYDLFSDDELLTPHAKLEFPFRSINSFLTIVGSCNGVLCLSDDRVYYMHTIILWNPCVKKSIILPKPNPIYNSYGTFAQSLGFGFDPVSSDYKVVFGEMPLPVSLVNNDLMRSKDLVVYMESLALILWNMNGAEPCFCVWVMKEYGVQESWIKHFSFDFHDFGGRILEFMARDLTIIGAYSCGELCGEFDSYRRGPYASDSATCKNYQLCTPVIVILSVAVEVIMSITRKEIASVAMEVTLK
ncbi:hypothetical protein DH2020_031855 [Rehmannia glutinosa]|uniref:F-box domain-containing protein n=1 Tax=Rehmannia glutinosa TaxID=99300 RepID=A0ABR0VGY0_REHGL